jgi:hypothetical protein
MEAHTAVSRRLRFMISVAALCSAMSVWAGDAGPHKGQWYVHPMITYYDPPAKLGYDDASTGPGIALGWSFAENWAMEAEYDTHEPDLKDPPGGKGNIDSWAANVVYLMPGPGLFTPFTTIGGGRGQYGRDSYGNGNDANESQYNFGVGTYIGTSKRIAFRADIRGLYTHDSEKLEPWAAVGVVFKFGRTEKPEAAAVEPKVVDTGG